MRRVLDKFTGSQYAAKFIHVCDEHQKRFFRTELNILRWLNQMGVPKVVDAFVTERRIVIITEMYPIGHDNIHIKQLEGRNQHLFLFLSLEF